METEPAEQALPPQPAPRSLQCQQTPRPPAAKLAVLWLHFLWQQLARADLQEGAVAMEDQPKTPTAQASMWPHW